MSDTALLNRICGWSCPTPWAPDHYVRLIRKPIPDANGYQRAERINGCIECPHCGLMWPMIEEPEEWTEGPDATWLISGWGPGFAECIECGAVFVDTFEGVFELKLEA